MSYRILIAEDYLMIRQVFEGAIAMSDGFTLAASLSKASDAIDYCSSHHVDLILMDVLFPGGINGLEASKKIKEISPETKIIIVTSMPEVSYISQAIKIGIEGFWHKEVQEQPIIEIMNRVMAGERVYPDTSPTVELGNAKSSEFTRRELDVLQQLVNGDTNKEIADTLGIAEKTVKNHITSMLQKTGFKTRLELAIRARDIGLVIGGSNQCVCRDQDF